MKKVPNRRPKASDDFRPVIRVVREKLRQVRLRQQLTVAAALLLQQRAKEGPASQG